MSPAALPTPSTVSKETLPSTLPTRPMLVRGGPTNEKNQQQHRAARDDFVAVDGAKPYSYTFPVSHTALLMIDMQRDFLLPGGFGEIEGGEDSLKAVQACIEPARRLLEACRAAGLAVFHTREGHVPDLADCPTSKLVRQGATGVGSSSESQHATARKSIGDSARMGRLLVRGEYGHDFIDKLAPLPGEVVVDKPGKGAFWGTELMRVLKLRGATHLLVAGVTTECCVTTTFREANDRGFECCVVTEATAGYDDVAFKATSLDILHWSQGLFGFVCNLEPLLSALGAYSSGSSSTGKDVSTSLTATITTASTAVTTANGSQTPPQTPPEWDGDLRITSLQAAYRAGISPVNVIHTLYAKIEAYESVNPGTWIHLLPKETLLSAAQDLEARWPDRRARPPLFGIPFSVKDSIDVSGLPTTTACPPLTHIPATSAPVYEASVAAGALFLGKANLDQLATGLTGQRSPYGAPSSVFHPSFISGGSSSGSAVHVGAGLASFSIATDTAGSGRVPAAFNGIVGYKPTRGTVSFVGITPACLRLDCVAIMTATVEDARTVYSVVEGFDARDPYAKPREWRAVSLRHVDALPLTAATASPMTRQLRPQFTFGIPPPDALAAANLSAPYRAAFASTVARLQRLGGVLRPIPWTPFREAGELLYDGTFVCERLAAIPLLDGSDGSEAATWLQRYREELHPVIATLFAQVLSRKTSGATQVFKELQTQQRLTPQVANEVFTRGATGVDVLVVPTTPTHFTKRQIAEEPIKRNSILGTFTHYGNVIDLCAVACPAALVEAKDMIPAGELEEDGSGGNADDNEGGGVLPFGVTFLGGTGADAEVLEIARRFEELARREGAI